MSVSKPKVGNKLGRSEVNGDCFLEQLDDDDGEIEPGSCEQSADPNVKHSRRYVRFQNSKPGVKVKNLGELGKKKKKQRCID